MKEDSMLSWLPFCPSFFGVEPSHDQKHGRGPNGSIVDKGKVELRRCRDHFAQYGEIAECVVMTEKEGLEFALRRDYVAASVA